MIIMATTLDVSVCVIGIAARALYNPLHNLKSEGGMNAESSCVAPSCQHLFLILGRIMSNKARAHKMYIPDTDAMEMELVTRTDFGSKRNLISCSPAGTRIARNT